MNKNFIVVISILLVSDFAYGVYKLQERYSWTQLDFAFPSQSIKEQAIAARDYIPQNGLPVGVEHWGNKLFVSVPRWRDGKLLNILRHLKIYYSI